MYVVRERLREWGDAENVTAEPSGEEMEGAKRAWRLTRETADRKGGETCVTPENGSTEADEVAADPDDELFLLGERCAEAYAASDALQYKAMKLLAEFHHRDGWQGTGRGSTVEWLAWRISVKPGGARERLRTALALEELPETSEAMRMGQLSFTKARALTRVATPENESALLEFAYAGSANNLERVVRAWKSLDRKSEVTAEQIRHRSRRFSAWVDETGMVVVNGRLDPEVGAVFMRAVEAANDALFRAEGRGEDGPHPGASGPTSGSTPIDGEEIKPEQRRADAMGLIAERALAAGFGGRVDAVAGPEQEADTPAPISGSRAERYQVMLHVDADTLQEDKEPGLSELEDGSRVSAETSRRLACDCGVVHINRDENGEVQGAGRRIRTVNPQLRRALEARDRGCRFPGCGLRFAEAHHVVHWADGGETTLMNTVLMCRTHHRAVHEGGVKVCLDKNRQAVFFTPKGKVLAGAPPRGWDFEGLGAGRRGVEEAMAGAEALNQTPAPTPRHNYDRDIPWEVEARVWDALDPE